LLAEHLDLEIENRFLPPAITMPPVPILLARGEPRRSESSSAASRFARR